MPVYGSDSLAAGGETFAYHWLYRTVNVILFATVILLALHPTGVTSFISRLLSARIWFPVAQVSYSLYLFHVPFLVVSASLLMQTNVISKESLTIYDSFTIAALGFLFSFLFSLLTFVFVEKPFINMRPAFNTNDRRSTAGLSLPQSQTAPEVP